MTAEAPPLACPRSRQHRAQRRDAKGGSLCRLCGGVGCAFYVLILLPGFQPNLLLLCVPAVLSLGLQSAAQVVFQPRTGAAFAAGAARPAQSGEQLARKFGARWG